MFVSVVSFLAGCANGQLAERRDLEDGAPQQGTVISCNGYKTWQDCDKAAAKACPAGYEVISKDENLPMQQRTLRISCKK
jgi:hypothetical protein